MKTRPQSHKATERYESIDIAKGFAIILVVVGHFVSAYMPKGYDVMVEVIYMFHMPLFMFASGFLYQATWRQRSYVEFLYGKFKRLMVPYFTVSILVVALKMCASGLLPVENPVGWQTLIEILYLPSAGYFLWFIWALWWMMVIIPAFRSEWSRKLLFAASFIILFISEDWPDVFCLRQFGQFLVFFSGGTVVADYMRRREMGSFPVLWQVLSVMGFAAMAIGIESGMKADMTDIQRLIITLVVNILGIAMGMTLAYWWRKTAKGGLLRGTYAVASYSYLIYLLHTTFEGFGKGVLYKIGWFEHSPELLMAWSGAIIVISCGVMIPLWLGRSVLNRWRVTSMLFGVPLRKR